MLAARILTAVILGPLVIGGIRYLPPLVMQGFFTLFIFIAALEWASLAGARTPASRWLYALLTVALAVMLHQTIRSPAAEYGVLIFACAWWAVAAVWIVHYQIREAPRLQSGVGIAILGWVVLIPAWIAVYFLLVRWPTLLIALFVLIWSADILAFFGGRALGRRRLASRISPGKTWEGLAIGLVGTLILSAIWISLLQPASLAVVLVIVAVTLIASVVGDLLESLLKRSCGKKDSGSILPGHGGILDRIDSLLAAAPVFTVGFISVGQQ